MRAHPVHVMLCALFLLCGAALVGLSGKVLWRAHASRSWPIVTGKIVDSTDGRRTWTTDTRGRGRESITQGRVEYSYEVKGDQYIGRRYTYSVWDTTPVEVTREFEKGHEVVIHYAPWDPTISVLVPGGLDTGGLVVSWFGLCIIFVSVLVVTIQVRCLIAERVMRGQNTNVFSRLRVSGTAEPVGLVIRQENPDGDIHLQIVKGRLSTVLLGSIFTGVWLSLSPVWFCLEGRISFWWSFALAVFATGLYAFVRAKGLPAIWIWIRNNEVSIGDSWGRVSGATCIRICSIRSVCAIEGYLSVQYCKHEDGRDAFYYRCSQAGLPKGTYPWMAALLGLLRSRYRGSVAAPREAPVWSRFGFRDQAELIAAVRDVSLQEMPNHEISSASDRGRCHNYRATHGRIKKGMDV